RVTLQTRRGPVIWSAGELFDAAFGRLEQARAAPVQLLAALPESDRLVHADLAALECANDLLELAAELLERRGLPYRRLAHGRTSSTVAASPPAASSISSALPGPTAAVSRSAAPSARTTAYPRARVARGESACRR